MNHLFIKKKLMEKEKFNQSKYIQEWNKQNKRQFKVNLNIPEYEELKKLLKENNLSNVQNDLKNKSN